MIMIHYPIKKFKNEACKTLVRIDLNGQKIYKDKKKYKDVQEAIKGALNINSKPNQIHKVAHYFCKSCQHWHLGRTNILIKKDD
jgi:uncharacterized protein YpuA (DUF1002 family)